MSSFPSTGRQALRRGRVSIPGQIYLLTTTTRGRASLFSDHEIARMAAHISASPAVWGDAALLAWVLMPDHWHGLVQVGNESLGRMMGRFKALVSRVLHAASVCAGPPFARSFHDRALRRDENVRQTARYIVGNPVRAGLVDDVMDYPYWDAVWLEVDQEASPASGLLHEHARCRSPLAGDAFLQGSNLLT